MESKQKMKKISVVYQHNRGLIFNVEEYLELRFKHRLPGQLIGVPTSKPRNSHTFALPAALSRFELRLALDEGLVELQNKDAALKQCPGTEEQKEYCFRRHQQIGELRQPHVVKRMDEFLRLLPKIIKGKHKKLIKNGIPEQEIQLDPEKLIEEEKQRLESLDFEKLIQIPMEHPVSHDYTSQNFQLNLADELKYKLFKDIWLKRLGFVTGGDSFGCDFLLYPGDPMYYHSSHVIHVIDEQPTSHLEQQMNVHFLIRCCRLAVVVNKICVLAYEKADGTIAYQTMEWEGNIEYDE
ncbi:uncharacterized protein LOC129741010 [Uranotaenia lowii]|uniref:uncharacterized protein LOC129741010 n=1 Tax=Uranotaenia lowii TaxID=190385 RepID=UPI00247906FE|nr:uncharacterized protein LOC129741010 [Uranotaenia lowii]XP_055588680.1 uncharacterized protein LOC129741010 [Uranotaenia lowii]XP_055588681.1 uncharacterized protein LOC129741010 [Uranotaenia lowii]XP_055588682.1 uncharacterized protein LOC129741010 [Uranotaenia lowii]XP_055588683.1 uncharacterized protein LOC129741010 [Uranotaenia lowii]